jgi:hypothetical protein
MAASKVTVQVVEIAITPPPPPRADVSPSPLGPTLAPLDRAGGAFGRQASFRDPPLSVFSLCLRAMPCWHVEEELTLATNAAMILKALPALYRLSRWERAGVEGEGGQPCPMARGSVESNYGRPTARPAEAHCR